MCSTFPPTDGARPRPELAEMFETRRGKLLPYRYFKPRRMTQGVGKKFTDAAVLEAGGPDHYPAAARFYLIENGSIF